MADNEIWERPEAPKSGSVDRAQLNRRVETAQDVQPLAEQDTFRYSDAVLRGEVRTNTVNTAAMEQLAVANVHRRDGTTDTVGTLRYRMEPNVVVLQGDGMIASSYGVESALLTEVSQNARAHGIDRMRVWAPDGDSAAQKRWALHGFQPEPRDPGAAGQHWGKPI